MKKYYKIDKTNRDSRLELEEHTLEDLKAYFTIDNEDYSNIDRIAEVEDIYDLREFLEKEAEGMAVPYEFVEVE